MFESERVEELRRNGGTLERNGVTLRLARVFGFCDGVERALRIAQDTRKRFEGRRLFLTSQLVHNADVNRRLIDLGYEFLDGRVDRLTPQDVVLIPAFGSTLAELDALARTGATLVDTTCGAVMSVWARVRRLRRDGYTVIIHGKAGHEETLATVSRAAGSFLVLRNLDEARTVARDIERGLLDRAGMVNQTTMLADESVDIQEILRAAFVRRDGDDRNFLAMDTICRATQDRQDAVRDLLDGGLDLLVVVGGENSSNTGHLAELGRARGIPTVHASGSDFSVPEKRPIVVGLTAGASTPDSMLGQVIQRLLQ